MRFFKHKNLRFFEHKSLRLFKHKSMRLFKHKTPPTNATSNGGDASRVGKIKRKCTSPDTARYAICPSRHSRGVMPVRSLNILYNWLRDVKPQADDTLSMVYSGWALM